MKRKSYTCYLVCSTVALTNPLGTTTRSVSHYIGTSNQPVHVRLQQHINCGLYHEAHAPGEKCNYSASRLVSTFVRLSGEVKITRTWYGGRAVEKRLKQYGNTARLCPNCHGKAAMQRRPKNCTRGRRYAQN